jgi:hypothetical protein
VQWDAALQKEQIAVVPVSRAWSAIKYQYEMKKFNRELLVLLADNTNEEAIEHEVECLHELLHKIEKTDRLLRAHNLIDVNKRMITSSPKRLKNVFKTQLLKPFVFLNNLN